MSLVSSDPIKQSALGRRYHVERIFSYEQYDKLVGSGEVDADAARYLFQDKSTEVAAFSSRNGDPRFQEVDEMTSAVMRFSHDRLASFTCSFGADPISNYTLLGTKGSLGVEPAYEYETEIQHY